MTLTPTMAGRLRAAGLDPEDTERVVRGALAEDFRFGPDVTSAATARPGARVVAAVVARQPGVLAGLAETGVDFVAVGALTHSSPALDLGPDLLPG
jgi:nicotinate-nucleotide pyrophosphorylase (carboxylating)